MEVGQVSRISLVEPWGEEGGDGVVSGPTRKYGFVLLYAVEWLYRETLDKETRKKKSY